MLVNRERCAGVSAFRLAAEIGAGEVLLRCPFKIPGDDTVHAVYTRLTRELVAEAVGRIRAGESFDVVSSAAEDSYSPMPTRATWRQFGAQGGRWA